MTRLRFAVSLVLLLVCRSFTVTLTVAQSSTQAEADARPSSRKSPNSKPAASSDERSDVRSSFIEAMRRVERDAAAMSPGRTWTWQLDAEQSREHLDGFRRDLNALSEAEAALEANLTPQEKSKFRSHFESMHELLRHVEADAQSLEHELQSKRPTRWHVARDVSDMQKEIGCLRKVNEEIEAGQGSNLR